MALKLTYNEIPETYLQIYYINLTRDPNIGGAQRNTKLKMEIYYRIFNGTEIVGHGTHDMEYVPSVHNVYEIAYSELKKIPGYEDAKDI